MKLAHTSLDSRSVVMTGYDRVAREFNMARVSESSEELAPLLAELTPGSTVLDLGCGAGVPIARALSRSHRVIGVDLSRTQLALASEQVPMADLIQADMSRCAFPPASFDAAVSFYAIFHLPLSEHGPLILRVAEWLKPGGLLLATFSPHRQDGYTEDFFGAEMYWSNLSLPEYRALVEAAGLEIVSEGVVGHGYADQRARAEAHPLVLARKVR